MKDRRKTQIWKMLIKVAWKNSILKEILYAEDEKGVIYRTFATTLSLFLSFDSLDAILIFSNISVVSSQLYHLSLLFKYWPIPRVGCFILMSPIPGWCHGHNTSVLDCLTHSMTSFKYLKNPKKQANFPVNYHWKDVIKNKHT